ncbi:MAG TPA: aspartate aminotransferase family protein [Actinomycetota bacterium]|nr:aspartate aminotransferase family protein [Actinomycetota bacterium]
MQDQDLAKLDMAHILHPHATVGAPTPPLIVARGEGALIWDVDGKQYIDGTCGLWQCAVGHGRKELARAAAEQLERLEFYPSFWDLSNEPAIRLAARLVSLAPDGLETVFYTNGGSEGVETAIKLARRAWHAQEKPERNVILSRKSAYHGVASASLAATGIAPLKEGFDPLPPGFVHLTTPSALSVGPNATEVLLDDLNRTIQEIGPENIGAFIGEPVMGVGGMIPPPEGYWDGVQDVLRRHGILLIADEVVTAYGRIGHWFGSERYGLRPDIIVTAKALTSGYIPMGAVLIGGRVIDMLADKPFRHGFTYNGHPVGAAVALANLDIIEHEGLLERAKEMGAYMLEQLEPLAKLGAVAEVRGVGLMLGVELPEGFDAAPVATGCREGGVIVRATGQKIVMSPPLIIEKEQIDGIVGVLSGELEKL